MSVIYQTADGNLTRPDKPKDNLHQYHGSIEDLVGCRVVGVVGRSGSIRQIHLDDECDISELEDWLGSDLVLTQQ